MTKDHSETVVDSNAVVEHDDSMSTSINVSTVVAIATAPGRGGIGVVRLSGPASYAIAAKLIAANNELELIPRHAHFSQFYDLDNQMIDEGLCLYFPKPHSFTGEDVIEIQGHGGPIVLNQIVRAATLYGARLAKPGEFSERAFLNGKIDLAQAEAIADLIASSSEQAAKSALNSLNGAFSEKINFLLKLLINLRMYVEAAIDFPEEEIDFLSDKTLTKQVNDVLGQFSALQHQAKQGAILHEGMSLVLVGRPNAGKSSLLNALAGEDHAIVTEIPGTTRDLLQTQIHINGMPLNIIDTAGLRISEDTVEIEGIKRAIRAIESADQLLWVTDVSQETETLDEVCQTEGLDLTVIQTLAAAGKVTLIHNKVDLLEELLPSSSADSVQKSKNKSYDFDIAESYEHVHENLKADINAQLTCLKVSAKHNQGIDQLRAHLTQVMGFESANESRFSARRRHIDALRRAEAFVKQGQTQLMTSGAGELLAEDLRMAQQQLGEITGEFTSDDLLGHIFSSFCIGK